MKNKNKFKIALALTLILPLFAQGANWWEDNLEPENWTASWATANKTITIFDGPLATINNATLRQIVRISEAGRMVRVSFTNEFGTDAA